MSVRLHAEAEAEIDRVADWYEARRAGLGGEFADELDRALATIADAPASWPLWPVVPARLAIRRFLIARFPFAVAFREESGDVEIFAVAHARRRPLYWLDRIP